MGTHTCPQAHRTLALSASQSWGADSQGNGWGGPSPDERFPESGGWRGGSCGRSRTPGLLPLSPRCELLEARHHPPSPPPLRSHDSSWVIRPHGFTSLAAGCRLWSGVFATTPRLPPSGSCDLGQGCALWSCSVRGRRLSETTQGSLGRASQPREGH